MHETEMEVLTATVAPRRAGRWQMAATAGGWLVAIAMIATVATVHLARLAEVPRGLFVDESSIGLNAATIAESGEDEDGVRFPVYFRAFGEYKNPVYIYTVALLFRLAGVSVWVLRLASFLFLAVLLGGVVYLARQLFPESRSVLLYALAAAGLLPWFFTVSRIAFEVISQPAVVAWMLCLAFAVYQRERPRWWLALALGGTAGLSIYTYSTARMLTPLFLATLLAAYAPRRFWRRHLTMLAALGVALIPYLVFSRDNPGALTRRFQKLTYVFNQSLPLITKIRTFWENYWNYWSPRYLLIEGDFNRRNSTGAAGELYFVVLALAVLGLVWSTKRGAGTAGKGRFVLLLAVNLLLAPAAAALTSGTSALRSILVGLYLLVFSCFGLAALGRIRPARWRWVAVAAVCIALAGESWRYLADYFGDYVEESAWAFKSYDFRGALEAAIRQQPTRVEVSMRGNQPYAHLEFFRRTLPPHHPEIPLVMSAEAWPRAEPGICIIYFNKDATILDSELYPSRAWGLDNPTILRCFDPTSSHSPTLQPLQPLQTAPRPSSPPPAPTAGKVGSAAPEHPD